MPRLFRDERSCRGAGKKSFSKAAEQLGLSPARVSESVRNLEERTGLAWSSGQPALVAATAAGERLLERLRPVLDDYQAAFEALEDFRFDPHIASDRPAAGRRLRSGSRNRPLRCAISRDSVRHIPISRSFIDIVEERFDAGLILASASRAT